MKINCFYVVGVHHEVLFEHCNCISVPDSLVKCGIWPATPVEPNLGFTFQLMEMTLRLIMECQVSIHDILKSLDFFNNLVIKVIFNKNYFHAMELLIKMLHHSFS